MKQEEILKKAIKRVEYAIEADKEEREQFIEDTRFEAGEGQWTDEALEARKGRPCLTFNKIAEKTDIVHGAFRQAEPSIEIVGVDEYSDPEIAELIEGIIRNIEYNSNARAAYNTAHKSLIVGGRGHWRFNLVDSEGDTFDRDIVFRRIPNALTVYTDPDATEVNRQDAKWRVLAEWMSIDKFNDKYKGVEVDLSRSFEVEDASEVNWRRVTDKQVRVAQYWWIEDEKYILHLVRRQTQNPEEPVIELTVTEENVQDGDEIIKTAQKTKPAVYYCDIIFDQILPNYKGERKPTRWPGRYIPIVDVYGKESCVDGSLKTRGMVRPAKEAQRVYNYMRSANVEYTSLMPKAPYLITPSMLQNFEGQWGSTHVKNYAYLLFNPDPKFPGGYPKREMPPQLSSGMVQEINMLDHEIMGAMGHYRASLGDVGDEKSGRAIIARQQQGDIGSFEFTDNMTQAMIFGYKILLDLIPKIYDSERLARIRDVDGTEKVAPLNATANSPLWQTAERIAPRDAYQKPMVPKVQQPLEVTKYLNDITVGKYDVRVTIGPSYNTQREEAKDELKTFVKEIPVAANASMDLIAGNMDFRGSKELQKRLKKMVPPYLLTDDPNVQVPEDPEQVAKKMELELKQRELMLKEAQLELDVLRAKNEQTESHTRGILNIAKAEAAEIGAQLQEYKAVFDQIRQDTEKIKRQQAQMQQVQAQDVTPKTGSMPTGEAETNY